MKTSFQLPMKPVLDSTIFEVPTTCVVVASFDCQQHCQKVLLVLKSLSTELSLPHLKILRKGNEKMEVIVSRSDQWDACKADIQNSNVGSILSDFREVEVALRVPQTQEQYDIANKMWPCAFHRSKKLTSLLNGTYFAPNELNFIDSVMRDCMIPTVPVILKRCSMLPSCPNLLTAIVCINSEKVIALSASQLEDHTLAHSVMMAIDVMAKLEGCGAFEFSCNLVECSSVENSQDFGSKGAKAEYLCTGYTAMLTHEPCAMCAMALLHSRISSVIYSVQFDEGGQLGSRRNMHLEKSFNHRFEVFKDFLTEEVKSAIEAATSKGD
ncbi:putative inactive tRNA-specific adenosine deaminase-like protein 3 isoform X2 [Convolutriloba macropyga]|uniref:putative inactive tRNA-specific adenosine deaminase-like protein 3 isoform X2 n=1 Tax=Convolutriloba macropyga TaxID=536237 RepID=UPI003F526E8B